MNRKFGIQNFRVFDDEGAQFKLAPITVLTGCNSSGKSSVIKAMMLFKSFLKDFVGDYHNKNMKSIPSYTLELNQGEHKLARFDKSLNKGSKCDEMVFSWSKHSIFANREVKVEFTFKENTKNLLGNGILNQIRIVCEGTSLYTINFGGEVQNTSFTIDFDALKDFYFDFVQKIANGENKFTIDFNPSLDKVSNHLTRDNLLYKNLSKVSPESKTLRQNSAYLYLKNSTEDEKVRLVSFFESLNNKDAKSNTLFHTPAYEYLKDATKENISELIYNKIESFDFDKVPGYIIYIKDNFIKNMGKIATSFIESEHTYFKDFISEKEKKFLSDQYTKEINIGGALSSVTGSFKNNFIASTIHRLKLVYSDYGIDTDFEIDTLNTGDSLSNFEQLYVFMHGLSNSIEPGFSENNLTSYTDSGYEYYVEKNYVALKEHFTWLEYISLFIEEAIFNLPDFIDNVEFINSNRPKVERFYDLSNLSCTFGHLIKEYVSLNANEIPIKDEKVYKLGNFFRKWVKVFEIADDVVFETTTEGSGIFIYLVTEGEKTLLADLGYGITQVLSMLLKIELSIINTFELSKAMFITDLGYSYFYENKEQTITIEEPEANLHPKLQSRLADMFIEANKLYNINFILETHSEYLIRKFQYLVASEKLEPEKAIVYYLNNPNAKESLDNESHVVEISINKDGSLNGDFGAGFFDEATNWKFELMRLKNTQNN